MRLTRRLFWERLSARPPDPRAAKINQGRLTGAAGYCRFTEDIPVKSGKSECGRYLPACGTGMRVLLLLYFFVDRDAAAFTTTVSASDDRNRHWRRLLPCAAAAEDYPSRSIRLVIPYAAGGSGDQIGRPWVERITSLLGPAYVENIGGAGGALGCAAVAQSAPDGYSLLLGNGSTQVIVPLTLANPLYDSVRDFQAIYRLITSALAFVVVPSLPVNNLQQLDRLRESQSGQVVIWHAGNRYRQSSRRGDVQAAVGRDGYCPRPLSWNGPGDQRSDWRSDHDDDRGHVWSTAAIASGRHAANACSDYREPSERRAGDSDSD